MSCNNNCTQPCGCSNCCQPPAPPTPPVPPTCEGTDCTELYDGACAVYSGPDIACFGVKTGNNFNTIVNLIATALCKCTEQLPFCENPLGFIIDRALFAYRTINSQQGEGTVSFGDTLSALVQTGIVLKKCNLCCPDGYFYGLAFSSDSYTLLRTKLSVSSEPPGLNYTADGENCFNELLVKSFGTPLPEPLPIPLSLYELGSFNNGSALCFAKRALDGQSQEVFTDFFNTLKNVGLIIYCNNLTGEIYIGSIAKFSRYLSPISNSTPNPFS